MNLLYMMWTRAFFVKYNNLIPSPAQLPGIFTATAPLASRDEEYAYRSACRRWRLMHRRVLRLSLQPVCNEKQ